MLNAHTNHLSQQSQQPHVVGRVLSKLPLADPRHATAAAALAAVLEKDAGCVHEPTAHAAFNLGMLATHSSAGRAGGGTAVEWFER